MKRAFEERTEHVSKEPYLVPGKGSGRRFHKRWLFAIAVALALIVTVPVVWLARDWPFNRKNVSQDLADATSTIVEIRNFRTTYFPHPGWIAEGVTFRRDRNPNTPPLITMQRLTVLGSYLGLLTKRVPLMRADGMKVFVLPLGAGESWPQNKSELNIVISRFVADGATVDFLQREPGKKPFTFAIHQFSIQDLGSRMAMHFKITLSNPEPPGEISASGALGPWRHDAPALTPVSGTYAFQRADLGVFYGVGGILSSDGKVSGTLKEMEVQGTTVTPDFEVTRSHHQFRLTTNFHAFVSGANGDVLLQSVNAHFWNTDLGAQGRVAEIPGEKGKTAVLEFAARDGRIQDILFMFIRDPRAPLTGLVTFKATATVPPDDGPFLRKVRLEGDFGIDDARFTNSQTQETVDQLSERARGEKEDEHNKVDPERVLSDLKGHVILKDGIAYFSNLSFGVPGATANMGGTFDLISERINLKGTLRLEVKLSEATSGVKSFLIKALDPILRNNRSGVPLPVSITGTYQNPIYKIASSTKK